MSYLICPTCKEEIHIFGKDGGKNLCKDFNLHLLGSVPMEIGLQQDEDKGENWLEKGDSVSAEEFIKMAEYIHNNTKPSCSADIGYVPQGEGCSPSACASCTLDCPSKKK